jgi:hypothetical protein
MCKNVLLVDFAVDINADVLFRTLDCNFNSLFKRFFWILSKNILTGVCYIKDCICCTSIYTEV